MRRHPSKAFKIFQNTLLRGNLELNIKFLFVTFTLAIVAGVFQNLITWLRIWLLTPESMSVAVLGLASLQLIFGVFIPFAVMYTLGMKALETAYKPILTSTFLGSWTGGVTAFCLDLAIIMLNEGSYGTGSLAFTIILVIWRIFVSAFSSVLFVCIAAVLFAYYRKRSLH